VTQTGRPRLTSKAGSTAASMECYARSGHPANENIILTQAKNVLNQRATANVGFGYIVRVAFEQRNSQHAGTGVPGQ